jgi:hypothetical protein
MYWLDAIINLKMGSSLKGSATLTTLRENRSDPG